MNVLLLSGSAESLAGIQKVSPGLAESLAGIQKVPPR